VFIHCDVKNGSVLLYFDDNGPGVPSDTLPRLFNVFYRGDVSRNNPRQGSGLGLAIAAKMISFIKGSIRAENLAEGGLRIIIKIPVVER
jgi:K+-sensing histidine kinase KdpD